MSPCVGRSLFRTAEVRDFAFTLRPRKSDSTYHAAWFLMLCFRQRLWGAACSSDQTIRSERNREEESESAGFFLRVRSLSRPALATYLPWRAETEGHSYCLSVARVAEQLIQSLREDSEDCGLRFVSVVRGRWEVDRCPCAHIVFWVSLTRTLRQFPSRARQGRLAVLHCCLPPSCRDSSQST